MRKQPKLLSLKIISMLYITHQFDIPHYFPVGFTKQYVTTAEIIHVFELFCVIGHMEDGL